MLSDLLSHVHLHMLAIYTYGTYYLKKNFFFKITQIICSQVGLGTDPDGVKVGAGSGKKKVRLRNTASDPLLRQNKDIVCTGSSNICLHDF